MSYMAKGHKVRVTKEDDEHFGNTGVIETGFGDNGDWVRVDFGEDWLYWRNVSSLLDLDI